MGRHHALADGRAVATPILRWGWALEGWGGKGALIDGQEPERSAGSQAGRTQ